MNELDDKLYDDYPMPVGALLVYGKPQAGPIDLSAFKNLNLNSSHIPLLIKMLSDERLNDASSESNEVWAPLHAWRILGQLKAKEAIGPMISLFEILKDDDWFNEEIPIIFGKIGKDALPDLEKYLQNPDNNYFPKIICAKSIKEIGLAENSKTCVQILKKQLRNYDMNHPTLNAFLILYIIDLKGNIPFSLIENSFLDEAVDETVMGTLEDVEARYSGEL